MVIIAAFLAVGGLAVAGWVRKSEQPAGIPLSAAQTFPDPAGALSGQPVGQPAGQPVDASDGYYSSRTRPVYIRSGEVVPEVVPMVEPASPPATGEQVYYTNSRARRHGRTKTHSVEIVAGSAAAGAAIGAIAGGGKGAAIGAISGGGAGLVYDRLTHNH
ncbi:MAG: hypothetical protein ABUS51_07265 [Acidobacteriota bacterium]